MSGEDTFTAADMALLAAVGGVVVVDDCDYDALFDYSEDLEEADAAMAKGETVDGREYLENLRARLRRETAT